MDRRSRSRGHSPYRKPAFSGRVAAAPRARRALTRNLRPSALIFALLGSAVAHASVLAPSAAAEPSTLTTADPKRDPRLPSGDGAYFITTQLACGASCVKLGPPPPAVAACYDRETLCDAGYDVSPADAYGHLLTRDRTWISVETGDGTAPERKVATAQYRAAIDDCLGATLHAQSESGQVFARVERRQDGTAISRVEALDGAVSPELVCCFREAQGVLASSLRSGAAVAFMLRIDDGTVEVKAAPR
jgi:hypothetical protein